MRSDYVSPVKSIGHRIFLHRHAAPFLTFRWSGSVPAVRKAGWLNSNGAVKHVAACKKSYISGVIRKSTEKPYFQKALLGAVSA
ncbi:hypothetical protein DXC27_12070 [Ruminococcus sp. OM08-7]|nr:hypothetical protein DXC27_12070 [Ruminococcus sp. OM08-7]